MRFWHLPFVIGVLAMTPVSAALSEGMPAESPLVEYAGSAACADCHQDFYKKWSRRLKASFVRYRKDIPGVIPGDRENSPFPENKVFLVVGKKRKAAFVDEGQATKLLNCLIDIPSPWPSPTRGRGNSITGIMGGFHVPYRHGFAFTAWIQKPGQNMSDINGTAMNQPDIFRE